ncbi:MAG: hypothetical protein K9J13_01905 [Saprospiraceae bacterium]|nr:hypothetical protein [Saprospiraceae bacterium]
MKTKLIKILIPPIIGFLIILGILILIAFIRNPNFSFIQSNSDVCFFGLFVPAALIVAMIIQWTLSIPIWEKFKTNKKLWGLSIFQLTGLVCIISGLAFGFTFWESSLGINEFLGLSILGIAAFAIYWVINIILLKILDR